MICGRSGAGRSGRPAARFAWLGSSKSMSAGECQRSEVVWLRLLIALNFGRRLSGLANHEHFHWASLSLEKQPFVFKNFAACNLCPSTSKLRRKAKIYNLRICRSVVRVPRAQWKWKSRGKIKPKKQLNQVNHFNQMKKNYCN